MIGRNALKIPVTKRVTVYLPDPIYAWLEEWAIEEQRPVSNLSAFLLERVVREHKDKELGRGVKKNESSKD